MLPVGVYAPDFELLAVNWNRQVSFQTWSGKKAILVFTPAVILDSLTAQLTRYQDLLPTFSELNTQVVVISDAPAHSLQSLAAEHQLQFPLLIDSLNITWKCYVGSVAYQPTEPAVFIVDEGQNIRAVYEPARYPHLPTPQILARAVRKLNEEPHPWPINSQDWRLGPASAPVTIIEYSDFQCHHCAEASEILRELFAVYGDDVQLVHRHLFLRQTHPLAQQAAEAAEAAGAQGYFWEMHRRLFAAGGALEHNQLVAYADEIGLDLQRFIADLDSGRYQETVNAAIKAAHAIDLKLPPAIFINGVLFEGARTLEGIQSRCAALLRMG